MSVFSNIFKNDNLPSNILDLLPDAVLFITPDGDIYKANNRAELIFKYSKKELCTKNLSELIENGIFVVESVLSTGKLQIAKAVIDNKYVLCLEINASINVSTETNKIIVTLRDVTDEYIQNADMFAELEEYKSKHIDKSKFLVNLANEIQSPLHSAIGFSQALLENLGGSLNEKQQKYISIIHKNNAELFALMTKIINLSRYENSSIDVELHHFDIVDFINNLLMLHRDNALKKNVLFNLETEGLLKRNCYSDVNLLKMAFNNLLDLIIKNTASDTLKIAISTPEEELIEQMGLNKFGQYDNKSFIMFNFVTGNFGIPFNEFPMLFNPYAQAERENKKFVEASLSFAIALKIAEFMKGTICVEHCGIQGISIRFIINLEQMETALNG